LDSISINQQQMGDASHQQTCVMCFLAIICFALNTELGCCVDGCDTAHKDAEFQVLSNEAPERRPERNPLRRPQANSLTGPM